MSELIAVVGATGLLGVPVVERLLDDEFGVRVLSRDPVEAKQRLGMRPEYSYADVTEYDSLLHAFEGCDAVHINLNTDSGAASDEVMHQGLANIGKAAKECGVEKISLIAGDWTPDPNHPWHHRAEFSKGILALESCGVPTVVWGCTWFMESLDYFVLHDRALMVGMQPLTWHFIAAEDYAKMVSAVMYDYDVTSNKRYTVHGLEGFKMFDALKKYCAALRPDLPVEQISIEDAKNLARMNEDNAWLESFADFMSHFEKFGETGNPKEAQALLDEPMLTLEAWTRRQLP